MMATYEHPMQCPRCQVELDLATDVTQHHQRAPQVGDFSVCGRCGAFLQFGERACTLVDLEQAPISEEDRRTVRRIQRFVRARYERYS